jgi:hypothetical protein
MFMSEKSTNLKVLMKHCERELRYVIKPLRTLLLIQLCAWGLCNLPAQDAATKIADTRLAPEQFPIFPWDELPAEPAKYQEAYECGFNLAGFAPPEALDAVHAAGMKCFVKDPRINVRDHRDFSDAEIKSNVSAVVQSAVSNPAVFGYHLIDEPAHSLIPTVAKWTRAVSEEIPSNQLAYVNLLPFPFDESGDTQSNIVRYEKYLTLFIELGKPKAFSYDNYALFPDGSIRSTFYLNMEIAREVSLKAGIPFWFVGLANTHFKYADPSYATFRFQVFTALAYGARGMGWFTYEPRDRGNYRSSAIDFDGRRSPTWDMLRAANIQIHRLGPIYLQLRSVNVFHYPEVPVGCHGIETSHYLKGVKGDGLFLVGEFEGPSGRPYFLIVNKSLTGSTQFRPELKKAGKLMKVSSFTGQIDSWSAENNWLAPGQGMLLFVDEAP